MQRACARRPAYEEIVRRAVYEIRQQQCVYLSTYARGAFLTIGHLSAPRHARFREMCEDGAPIKALTFLQTRVSSVVNHEDAEEARTFRALLSAHLLAAPARPPVASSSSRPASSLGFGAGPVAGASASAHADSPPPRKRSRPSSPASGGGSGIDAGAEVGAAVIRYDEDPLEAADGASAPSPERYRQRTEMFERLLGFVNAEAKQPEESLMEMWSGDGLMI